MYNWNMAKELPPMLAGMDLKEKLMVLPDYDEDIKNAITTLYDQKEREDVFELYNKYVKEEQGKEAQQSNKIIIWNLIITTLATVIIITYVNVSNKKLLIKLTNNNITIEDFEVEEVLEDTEENENTEEDTEIEETAEEEIEEDDVEEEKTKKRK